MVSEHGLHPARDEEVLRLWPVVQGAGLFDTLEGLERFRADAPWRVQVTESGELAVLERWRSHLDVLAVKGLWCSARRIPALVGQLNRIARQQGFGRLLSPLVPTGAASPYERAGMTPYCTIVVLRYDHRSAQQSGRALPTGVRLRLGSQGDLDELMCIENECFDSFWRCDHERLNSHLAEDRIVVAESEYGVIGYTLATVMGDSGTLGRLAVRPSQRRRGIGEALLVEAVAYLLRAGVGDVSICTQEENLASRALYRRAGLRESPGRLLFLVGSTEAEDMS